MSDEIPQDAITEPWWDGTRSGRLLLQQCTACDAVQHPPRALCRGCGSSALEWIEASGEATIDSFTVVSRQIRPEMPPPYVIARVRLPEGPLMLTNIVGADPESLCCDQAVIVGWRPLADGRQLPVFTTSLGSRP